MKGRGCVERDDQRQIPPASESSRRMVRRPTRRQFDKIDGCEDYLALLEGRPSPHPSFTPDPAPIGKKKGSELQNVM